MGFAWWWKCWKDTANSAPMRERCSRVSGSWPPCTRVNTRRLLTRDRIRNAARTPGGGKGDDWDYKKQPGRSGSTRGEDSSFTISVGLVEDIA